MKKIDFGKKFHRQGIRQRDDVEWERLTSRIVERCPCGVGGKRDGGKGAQEIHLPGGEIRFLGESGLSMMQKTHNVYCSLYQALYQRSGCVHRLSLLSIRVFCPDNPVSGAAQGWGGFYFPLFFSYKYI